MSLFKKVCLAIVVLLSFSMTMYAAEGAVLAGSSEEVCKGVNLGGSADCDDGGAVTKLLKTIITIISWVAGIITIIMVIISGIKFTTSGGDSAKVTSAKGTLTYALIGAVVVILAQVIVKFVLGQV